MNTRRLSIGLLAAGAIALGFAVASITAADPDLWAHMRFGVDMLRTHHIATGAAYSFTQDRPWRNHEWLSEVVMAASYTIGGSPGLVLLKAVLVFAAAAVVWRACHSVDLGVRFGTFALWVVGTGRMTKTMRPQLWSLLLFALLCAALVHEDRKTRRWLPLLFAIWANVHGGWPLGLAVLGTWAAGMVLVHRSEFREWVLLVLGCVVATLVSPYGWTLWSFIPTTVGANYITEWQPLWTTTALAMVAWMIAVVAAVWGVARRPFRFDRAVVFAMLAYASLRVERLLPFFVTAVVVLLGPELRKRWPSRSIVLVPSRDLPVAAALCAAAVAAALWIGASSLRCISVEGDWTPDVEAARSLDHANDGRLVTFFSWGQYAMWWWGRSLRVSIDGRSEAYSPERVAEHDAIVSGSPDGFAALRAWRPEYVWLPAEETQTRQWLSQNGYRIDVQTPRSFVGVRDDLPRLMAQSPLSTVRRCFPE